jgi:hypothetical protein
MCSLQTSLLFLGERVTNDSADRDCRRTNGELLDLLSGFERGGKSPRYAARGRALAPRVTIKAAPRHSMSHVRIQEGVAAKRFSISGICPTGKPQPPLGEVQEDKPALRLGGAVSRLNALVRSRSAVVLGSHSHPTTQNT